MSAVKTWDFTLNNYTDAEIKMMHAWQAEVNRMVVAREVGESGTPHLQGRITFKRSYRLGGLKKLCSRAHWEPTKAAQDFLYCMKEGSDVIINVDNRRQGTRTDLKRLRDEIASGEMNAKKIREDNPMVYHQYGRTIDKIEDDKKSELIRTWQTQGVWYWGPTGTGKSHKAFEGLKREDYYVWNQKEEFQDYDGQEVVIIDDFRGSIDYNFLLVMIDKHDNCRVKRKGRPAIPFVAKKVIITSCMPPEKVYCKQNEKDDSIKQLLRRINVVHLAVKCTDKDDGIGSIM